MAKRIKENGILYEVIMLTDQNGKIVTYVEVVGSKPKELDADVKIPALISGIPVTKIGPAEFQNNFNIKSVEVSGYITHIADDAFYNCSNMRSFRRLKHPLNMGGIAIIGPYAFSCCSTLQSFVLEGDTEESQHIKIIRRDAFFGCNKLCNFECYIDYVEPRAFHGCTSLQNLSFGNECYIHPNALSDSGLEKVYFCEKISDKTLEPVQNHLKKLDIFCTDSFNHLDWAYEGVNINVK